MSRNETNGPRDSEHDVPEGWAAAKLKDVVAEVQPGFACGVNNREGDGVAHLRPMNVNVEGEIDLSDLKYVPAENVDSPRKWLSKGDVLFNNTNSTELVGKTAYYCHDEPRAFSNHMTRVRVQHDTFNAKYCAAYVHQCWRSGHFQEVCNQHVSQSSVSGNVLLDTSILVPPLSEQARIMTKVETVLERVNKARKRLDRLPEILKRFRQSVLASACSGGLTAEWRDRNQELEPSASYLRRVLGEGVVVDVPSETDPVELPEVPDTWAWTRCGEICDSTRALTYGVIKLGPPVAGGVPTLRSSDVRWLYIDDTHIKRISEEIAANFSRTFLQGGEIVVTVRGTLGGVAVVPDSMAGFNISREVAMLPVVRHLNPQYVAFSIASLTSQNWLSEVTKGVAYTGVNIRDLKLLPVAIPPVDEQYEIVRRVNALMVAADRIQEQYLAGAKRTERITQSVLAKAFAGELVETEAELARREGRDYEPAWFLLERLKSERESHRETTRKETGTKVAKRKVASEHQLLTAVLASAKGGLSPEHLLQRAGFDESNVEQFYCELRDAIRKGTIIEKRPNKTDVILSVKHK